ncbi:hypothetical protein FE249_00830 [Acidiphilium multivorum]|uniref:hypothetical protein n=1 Tax=Acidiphilium multivorum TaxID=62140 RepID=UPI001F4C3599|nr:hypothetical protein [Acidiphilium multivorum]UNC12872.1 hypothetical protein FE249_00830 [Acidiphilium multivorum]
MATVTLREFGRMRGISGEAVRRAIAAGRLTRSVVYDDKGRPRIDPGLAEGEWGSATHPTHGGKREAGAIAVDSAAPAMPASQAAAADPGEARGGGNAAATFAQSRAIREAYLARLAKLEFEERSKQVVRVDEVKNEAFKVARQVREAMLNIPDRLAAELAAASDPFMVHKRLADEIRQALAGALPGAEA